MNRRRFLLAAGMTLTALALVTGVALAAMPSYHVQRFTLASSGSSSGGDVMLKGSLGQSLVGQSSGGDVAMRSGYWAGAAPAEETPGITPTPTEQVTPTPTEQVTSTPTGTPGGKLFCPLILVDS